MAAADLGSENREIFDLPASVDQYERYAERQGLTPCEEHLFDRFVPVGARVLDVGVGTGRTTAALHARAGRYLGLDYAEHMVERCRALHPGVDVAVGDAADLSDMADGEFDVVVFSFNGVDCVSDADRLAFYRECRRVLTRPGTLILSRHNPRGVIELVNSAFPREHDPRRSPLRASVRTARSLRRNGHVLLQRSFWTGAGTLVQPPHRFAAASPRRTRAELEALGFELREQLPSTHPHRGGALTAPWFYYSFSIEPGT